MRYKKAAEQTLMRGFIELLNDMGMNIVLIENTFFAFTSFEAPDDSINEITLVGRDITTLVENETSTAASNTFKKQELLTRINEIINRRRVYHRDTLYTKFVNTN